MRRLAVSFTILVSFGVLLQAVHAQAVYTATRAVSVQLGIGALYLHSDFRPQANEGLTVWGACDFSRHVGLEASFHAGGLRAPDGVGERSYTVGPRLMYRHQRAKIFATLSLGQGTITNQVYGTASTFNLYSYGAGFEYVAGRHVVVRAVDIEEQRWLNFIPHGLSPVLVTSGVSYVIP